MDSLNEKLHNLSQKENMDEAQRISREKAITLSRKKKDDIATVDLGPFHGNEVLEEKSKIISLQMQTQKKEV